MATKKYTELTQMSVEELNSTLEETRVGYSKLKFDHSVRGLENPKRLTEVRKDIARLATEVRRREVEAMTDEQKAKRSRIRTRRK